MQWLMFYREVVDDHYIYHPSHCDDLSTQRLELANTVERRRRLKRSVSLLAEWKTPVSDSEQVVSERNRHRHAYMGERLIRGVVATSSRRAGWHSSQRHPTVGGWTALRHDDRIPGVGPLSYALDLADLPHREEILPPSAREPRTLRL